MPILVWVYIHLVFFILQSVASIEQRTRPNLSKTLTGELLFFLNVFPPNVIASTLCWWDECTGNMLTHSMFSFFRAGPEWRTRASSSWCHHTPNHVVQTLLYLIRWTQALSQSVDFILVSRSTLNAAYLNWPANWNCLQCVKSQCKLV